MFRRYFFSVAAAAIMLFSASQMASAQVGQLRGHVVFNQADGTSVPAAGAVVDVFRSDVAGKYETKTDKKGSFIFAGLPYVGRYVIGVSMPGARPSWHTNVRAGQEIDYKIELAPGDGSRLTFEQIKTSIAATSGSNSAAPAPSSEDRAKRAELDKKNAELAEKNRKATESNEIMNRTFKAGNEALRAKNFDLAIAQFNEGLAADVDHPGAPALMTNKAAALTSRGIQRYNAAVTAKDDASKNSGLEGAKADWKEAADSASKAVQRLKATAAATDPAGAASAKTNLYFALFSRAEAMRYFVTKVDQTQVDAGVTAFEEYLAAEPDAAKKLQGEKDLAQMLFDANAFDRALAQYQKILANNPDDLDSLLRSGQALFNIGAINSDKVKYQEAANYLAQFVEKAPDSNAFKADAKAILEALKQENVKPERAPAPRRRRP